ncbi:MAG: cobalt ECF transporter T component CbiQ [Methanobacterium sp.]
MFEDFLDRYAQSNAIRNVNTYYKVLFGIITMIVSLVSTSPVIPLTVFILVSSVILFVAKIPAKFYLKFVTIPLSFASITFVFMAVWFGTGSYIYSLGLFNLGITASGFNLGFLVFSRMMGGFACLAFLGLTTPLPEIFSVLEDFKFPEELLEITMLMYRYVFISIDEALKMYNAQQTRLGYSSSLKKTFDSMGMLIANIFIRTWTIGEKSYVSMQSRCYNGKLNTMDDHDSISGIAVKNLVALALFEMVLSVGVYFTASFHVF